MDEVSQEQLDDAWDEGFAHGYSRGNEEGLKIAFKDGYDFGAKTVSAEFTAEIERLRKNFTHAATIAKTAWLTESCGTTGDAEYGSELCQIISDKILDLQQKDKE